MFTNLKDNLTMYDRDFILKPKLGKLFMAEE